MSLRYLDRRHLTLVSLYSARHAVRGGTGLVFAVVTLFFGLITASVLLDNIEAGRKALQMSRADLVRDLVKFARPAVEWAIGGGAGDGEPASEKERAERDGARRWAAYLLDEQPALLSAIWLILVLGLPFLVALGSFNQLSGDVQSKGIRYQLLRTDRSNIIFGRFLGTLGFTLAVLLVVVLTIGLYTGLKFGLYEGKAVTLWSLRAALALAVMAIPYVALCSWISAAIDSPFASLTLCHLVIGGVPLLALIGRSSWKPLAAVNYALPWALQNQLLHPDALHVAGAAAACLGYAAVFLALGYFHFSRRDL